MEKSAVPHIRDNNLERLLDHIEMAGNEHGITLRAIVDRLGRRSFGPMLLVPSLAIVSPASVVPTVPSLLGFVIGLIALQMMLNMERIWLPGFLLDKQLSKSRFSKTMAFMRPFVLRIDPCINERMTWLCDKPGNLAALTICCVSALLMPFIEFVPFLTSFIAAAIALFALGILFRDGLLMLLGYIAIGGAGTLVVQMTQEIVQIV